MRLWKRETKDRVTCRVCGVTFEGTSHVEYAMGGIVNVSAKDKFKEHAPPIGCLRVLEARAEKMDRDVVDAICKELVKVTTRLDVLEHSEQVRNVDKLSNEFKQMKSYGHLDDAPAGPPKRAGAKR